MSSQPPLPKSQIKKRLQQGEVCCGVMCMEFATSGIGRIAATAGAEFVVFDMEHTGWTLETIKMLVATSRSVELLTIVRVPTNSYHYIAHALDVGAGGIVIPLVESAEQARQAVACALYPPLGRRGCAFGIAHDDFRSGNMVEKIQSINESMLVIPQIETVAGVEQAESIASVAGVDAIWVGPYDLSVSLGVPGQFDHPKLKEAIDHVHQAARRHNRVMVLGTLNVQQLLEGPKVGYQMLIYTADFSILQQALRSCFDSLSEAWPN
jgi:2-keto-3-deoxy-L-rhamnonate aldolase RhmA